MALMAVIAGHGLFRPAVAGSPVALSVAGPPHVGDCVVSAPDPTTDFGSPAARYLDVAFGPCNGAVAGEVASVSQGRTASQDGSIGALMGTSGACWAAATRYVGLSALGEVASAPTSLRTTVDWRPDLRVRGQLIGADVLQRAAGRDWSACLVRPEKLETYLGSVRGALAGGAAPAEYGDCSPSTDTAVFSWVDCARPHPTERLGWAVVPAGTVAAVALAASCRQFAAFLLRTGDPTYSGVLDIVVGTGDLITCTAVIRGDARLVGSLIGIGPGPLPLTT